MLGVAQPRLAAPGKFEVKSHGSLSHNNDCKLFPLTAILPQTSWDLLNMAWEEAGRHPQWPQVADVVIEAHSRKTKSARLLHVRASEAVTERKTNSCGVSSSLSCTRAGVLRFYDGNPVERQVLLVP